MVGTGTLPLNQHMKLHDANITTDQGANGCLVDDMIMQSGIAARHARAVPPSPGTRVLS